MDVAEAMPVSIPKSLSNKDYPTTSTGISGALTNLVAALALDAGPLVAFANGGYSREEAMLMAPLQLRLWPGPMCSAVTAQLVPLLQPIIFSDETDRVFGSTAGLSARHIEQLRCIRRRDPDW
jgi:hypothetical protein